MRLPTMDGWAKFGWWVRQIDIFSPIRDECVCNNNTADFVSML